MASAGQRSADFSDAADIRLTVDTIPGGGRFLRWSGEFRWFLFRDNPLVDDAEEFVRWYGTNTDLEERKLGRGAPEVDY